MPLQHEGTAAPSASAAAAAAASLPSPFASPLKPFGEEEEIEGNGEGEEDGGSGAACLLERAPPVSRYERDAPPPPPLADRPIQWWRSNAAAAAASKGDGWGDGGAKFSSSSSRRRRRGELSSHPCEIGESGGDLEQGNRRLPAATKKLPGEEGQEGEAEESSDGEEEDEDDPIVGKPNVRDRKLVPALTLDGRLVAAPAEQYAVLVMDVPDLPAAAERARERRRWRLGGGGGERVADVIGGDGDAGDDDGGDAFGTGQLDGHPSSSSRPSSVLRAAASGARAGGRFVKHVILGKRRLAVSAEVMAAARSRAAAEGASRRSGSRQAIAAGAAAGALTAVEAEKAAASAAAAVAAAPAFVPEEKKDAADGDDLDQNQRQRPPSPTLPFLLEDLLDDDVPIEPSIIVEETFRRLFPESFRAAGKESFFPSFFLFFCTDFFPPPPPKPLFF